MMHRSRQDSFDYLTDCSDINTIQTNGEHDLYSMVRGSSSVSNTVDDIVTIQGTQSGNSFERHTPAVGQESLYFDPEACAAAVTTCQIEEGSPSPTPSAISVIDTGEGLKRNATPRDTPSLANTVDDIVTIQGTHSGNHFERHIPSVGQADDDENQKESSVGVSHLSPLGRETSSWDAPQPDGTDAMSDSRPSSISSLKNGPPPSIWKQPLCGVRADRLLVMLILVLALAIGFIVVFWESAVRTTNVQEEVSLTRTPIALAPTSPSAPSSSPETPIPLAQPEHTTFPSPTPLVVPVQEAGPPAAAPTESPAGSSMLPNTTLPTISLTKGPTGEPGDGATASPTATPLVRHGNPVI